MAESIKRQLTRELAHAFVAGKDTFSAFGKLFTIEHVRNHEYRVTLNDADIGLRFMAESGKLKYFMA